MLQTLGQGVCFGLKRVFFSANAGARIWEKVEY
jgi:hypothetical protein